MRTYTFALGKLMEGLVITHDEKLRADIVFLGDENSIKSRCKKVSMDKNNPALIQDGLIKFAHPRSIKDKKTEREKFVVLAQPMRGTNDILVRVNTSGMSDTGKTRGWWLPKDGNPQTKYKANGSRPSGLTYCDDLVTMSPGDSLIAYPEGEESGFEIKNFYGKARCFRTK